MISKSRSGKESHVEYKHDVIELLHDLQKQPGKDIYCDGGSEIVFELLKHSLIDRLIVSIIPHLLGSGIKLFKDGSPEQQLSFKSSITYPKGLAQLWYDKKENQIL